MLAGDTTAPGSPDLFADLLAPGARLAHPSVRATPHRRLPHGRLPEDGGDEVPRQPDRLGRPAVPPGQHGEHQRGDAALRPGRRAPRAAAAEDAAAGAPPLQRPSTSCEHRLDGFSDALVADREPRPAPPGHRPSSATAPPLPTLYFCIPPERQAARLLGHGRRPPLQDPPLHEHRGRGPAARAVRAAASTPAHL